MKKWIYTRKERCILVTFLIHNFRVKERIDEIPNLLDFRVEIPSKDSIPQVFLLDENGSTRIDLRKFSGLKEEIESRIRILSKQT